MSAINIAQASNEVAKALPSTATVHVSRFGNQAVEALSLEARTVSDSQVSFTRTFSGLEVITNPYLRMPVAVAFTLDGFLSDVSAGVGSGQNGEGGIVQYKQLENAANKTLGTFLSEVKETIRPNFDPVGAACSNVTVNVNNQSLSITPEHDYRVINAAFPSQQNPQHQRDHYGLNQLDKSCVPETWQWVEEDDLIDREHQHNISASRSNYPVDLYYFHCHGKRHGTAGDRVAKTGKWVKYGEAAPEVTGGNFLIVNTFVAVFDFYYALNHPFFDDTRMRDDSLVNVRYFDVHLNVKDVKRMVQHTSDITIKGATILDQQDIPLTNIGLTDDILVANSTGAAGSESSGDDEGKFISGQKATHLPFKKTSLNMDLVTPSVSLPTVSDKVVRTLSTTIKPSVAVNAGAETTVNSQNIQLAQIPDMIYVFARNKADSSVSGTYGGLNRLAVITSLTLRTPQNSAFLLNMDQEQLYQMSRRNGIKMSRKQFMCTTGSIIAIDPERDLGGYTNSTLIGFTFDVKADLINPCASSEHSLISLGSITQMGRDFNFASGDVNSEYDFMVVCEQMGHLYLMTDGTGKMTRSNITLAQVADAVADGVHHPSTLNMEGKTGQMDAGLLGNLSKAAAEPMAGDDPLRDT